MTNSESRRLVVNNHISYAHAIGGGSPVGLTQCWTPHGRSNGENASSWLNSQSKHRLRKRVTRMAIKTGGEAIFIDHALR